MENNKKLIVIAGATATGKTAKAIEWAKKYETEVISADSRQFYIGMDIGTAKITAAEMDGVPHHFVDCRRIDNPMQAGEFEKEGLLVLENIFNRNNVAIMAGGSGLYIQALCKGLNTFPDVPNHVKQTVAEQYKLLGISYLQETLRALDPIFFEEIDRNNPARLTRAVEVCLSGDKPFSHYRSQPVAHRPFEIEMHVLDVPREVLYKRIDDRVDTMVIDGLEEEVRGLLPYRHEPVFNTVGYVEWLSYFDGEATRAEVIDKIKQHSRNYAKRQETWFRKYS